MYEELLNDLNDLLKLQRAYCDGGRAAAQCETGYDYRCLHDADEALYEAKKAFERKLERTVAWLPGS